MGAGRCGCPTSPRGKRPRCSCGRSKRESRAAAVGIPEPDQAPVAGELLDSFAASLVNRNAVDDRGRLQRHLRPVFAGKRIADITLASVMAWIDAQRAAGSLSEASIRHNLNLLSRLFSWAIERGHATINPVRQIPTGRRPQQTQRHDVPWLRDDEVVRLVMNDLPEPVDVMFYLGNRSGLRTGEIVGLRMDDVDFLVDGAIRVRFSYGGPLKEDKGGVGKVKWAPASEDAPAVLGPWLERRRAEGAGPEDLVFPCASRDGGWYRKEYIEACWERVSKKHRLELTWYEATRHSFTSRNLERGASLDEVSSALGHSSPVVTRRYYDHFVRRSFSSTLRAGLGLGGEGKGTVIRLRRKGR